MVTPPANQSPPGAGRASIAAARARASALIDLGRHLDAVRAAEEGLASAPADPVLLRLRAIGLRGAGRLYDAADAATEAIAAAPNDANGFVVRSSVLAAQAKALTEPTARRRVGRQASQAAAEAVRLAPHMAAAYRQMAEALSYAGEPEQAWAAARQAAELAPHSEATWITFSVVGITCGADPVAIEVMARKALAINPQSYAALNNLGVALMQQGRQREAAPLLRQAAAVNPGRDTAVENLVRVGTSVIRLAVLAAVSTAFFTPLGPATFLLLALAAAVLFRPWATKRMRAAAIKAALALPRLRLPTTTALLGLAAAGLATYTLINGGSRPLGLALLAGGTVVIVYPPARRRLRRSRIARRGLDHFPKRPVRSRLARTTDRSVKLRPIFIVIWLGLMITNAVIHSNSHQSGTNPSDTFSSLPIPYTPVTDQPMDPSNPSSLVQTSALPSGYTAVPQLTGPLTTQQVQADYGADMGVISAYRLFAQGANHGSFTTPGSKTLTETAFYLDTAAHALSFAKVASHHDPTAAAALVCPGVYDLTGPGPNHAGIVLVEGTDVLDVQFDHDSTSFSDAAVYFGSLVPTLQTEGPIPGCAGF